MKVRSLVLASLALGSLLCLADCSTAPVEPPAPSGSIETVVVDLPAAQDQISAYRRSRGLPAVVVDAGLVAMAQSQADAMASSDQLSHDVGGNLVQRLAAAHRPTGAAVENVSAGYASIGEALDGWRRSAMHDANLRDPRMRRMGIAAALAPSTHYKRFWALVMTE